MKPDGLREDLSAADSQRPPSTSGICTCDERESDANAPIGGWQGALPPPCPVHGDDDE
jgi:hypothetical protein